MKISIRKTKTASGATAVQVVRYDRRKLIVLRHVGSGHTAEEISALYESAQSWIKQRTKQLSLFGSESRRTISLATTILVGTTHVFAHEIFLEIARQIGFGALPPLLLDLAVIRLIEPCSKLRSFELLKRYFNISYVSKTAYRTLRSFGNYKKTIEDILLRYVQQRLSDDLSLVLYDVTTLYFETFEGDNFRTTGFSKDNKPQQPQIMVGLLVNRDGFPLGYEIFNGNTFEGHTMLPILKTFSNQHGVKIPTVVADAAMLSRENIKKLAAEGYSYIVGARLGNLALDIMTRIVESLPKKDGAIIRIPTDRGDLVCSFSEKRYRKDKKDMERQIERAKKLVVRGEPGRRAKFVRKAGGRYVFDNTLKLKTESLLGIKGYHTNIPESTLGNTVVIERYNDLWRVEQSFRISKHDLAARPIFHRTENAIRAHLLICIIALAIAKTVELETSRSLRRVRDVFWNITDATLCDTVSEETFTMRTPLTDDVHDILQKIGVLLK